MRTTTDGTFVISWSQTELDGIAGASVPEMRVGATWRWSGQAIRVDGPDGIMVLGSALGMADLHERAARKTRRICGEEMPQAPQNLIEISEDQLLDRGFVLTDGQSAWAASRIEGETDASALVVFLGALPPPDTELWVARVTSTARADSRDHLSTDAGVICFASGTRISTPDGERPVEGFEPGDVVMTRDDGPQKIVWMGERRLSSARLHMSPHLRPVRIRSGVLGPDRPDGDLLVSPNHRLLIQGPAAQALFSETEVLACAGDLTGVAGISPDLALAEVTYVHLMLERHQILFANGVQSESFHPEEADISALSIPDRERLVSMMPFVTSSPSAYGRAARRRLSAAEAAILTSDSTPG